MSINVKKRNAEFSFTEKIHDYLRNPDWQKGFYEVKNGTVKENETEHTPFNFNPYESPVGYSSVYQLLSAGGEEIANQIYERIDSFTKNIVDIDTCELDQLYSIAKMLGYEGKLSYLNYEYPKEIYDLLCIFSVKSDILFKTDAIFKCLDTIITVRDAQKTETTLSVYTFETQYADLTSYEVFDEITQRWKPYVIGAYGTPFFSSVSGTMANDVMSGYSPYMQSYANDYTTPVSARMVWTAEEFEQIAALSGDSNAYAYIDDEKYLSFIESTFASCISGFINLKYRPQELWDETSTLVKKFGYEMDNTYIYQNYSTWSKLTDPNLFDTKRDNGDDILSLKLRLDVPLSFNEKLIVDNIQIGKDSIEKYDPSRQIVLQYELNLRQTGTDANRGTYNTLLYTGKAFEYTNTRTTESLSRFARDREQKVIDYFRFVESFHSLDSELFSDYLVNEMSIRDKAGYVELLGNTSSNFLTVTNEVAQYDPEYIETLSKVLRNVSIQISYIRDAVKQLAQKYYISGTANLIKVSINELFAKYIYGLISEWRLTSGNIEAPLYYKDLAMPDSFKVKVIEYWDPTEYMNIKAVPDTYYDTIISDSDRMPIAAPWINTSRLTDTSQYVGSLDDELVANFYDRLMNVGQLPTASAEKATYIESFLTTVFGIGAESGFIVLDNDKFATSGMSDISYNTYDYVYGYNIPLMSFTSDELSGSYLTGDLIYTADGLSKYSTLVSTKTDAIFSGYLVSSVSYIVSSTENKTSGGSLNLTTDSDAILTISNYIAEDEYIETTFSTQLDTWHIPVTGVVHTLGYYDFNTATPDALNGDENDSTIDAWKPALSGNLSLIGFDPAHVSGISPRINTNVGIPIEIDSLLSGLIGTSYSYYDNMILRRAYENWTSRRTSYTNISPDVTLIVKQIDEAFYSLVYNIVPDPVSLTTLKNRLNKIGAYNTVFAPNVYVYPEYELYKKYSGQALGQSPFTNFKNQIHATSAIHPIVKNLVEVIEDSKNQIKNLFNMVLDSYTYDLTSDVIASRIDAYGNTIDSWRTTNVEYTGYTTAYETNTNLNEFGQIEDKIGIDGPWNFNALNAFIANPEEFISTVSAGTNEYYTNIDLLESEFIEISHRLSQVSGDISLGLESIKGLRDASIYKYTVDIYDNHYMLYKDADEYDTSGKIWVRYKNHPLALPIAAQVNMSNYLNMAQNLDNGVYDFGFSGAWIWAVTTDNINPTISVGEISKSRNVMYCNKDRYRNFESFVVDSPFVYIGTYIQNNAIVNVSVKLTDDHKLPRQFVDSGKYEVKLKFEYFISSYNSNTITTKYVDIYSEFDVYDDSITPTNDTRNPWKLIYNGSDVLTIAYECAIPLEGNQISNVFGVTSSTTYDQLYACDSILSVYDNGIAVIDMAVASNDYAILDNPVIHYANCLEDLPVSYMPILNDGTLYTPGITDNINDLSLYKDLTREYNIMLMSNADPLSNNQGKCIVKVDDDAIFYMWCEKYDSFIFEDGDTSVSATDSENSVVLLETSTETVDVSGNMDAKLLLEDINTNTYLKLCIEDVNGDDVFYRAFYTNDITYTTPVGLYTNTISFTKHDNGKLSIKVNV